MANRYWVGGTAAWDATAGTKWALTSGGAGGEAVPTATDDVFFDAASGAVTCTITGSRVAKSINCTGFTGTLAGASTPALTISGSLTLVAGMTLTYAGTTTFNATATITSGGKTLGGVTVNGSGITVTLGDALNLGTNTLTVTTGTFTTANFNVTCGSISSSNANTRTITLGSSTVTLSGATSISLATTTNLTFNANTSQIDCSANSTTFDGGGLTFYNVSFTSTALSGIALNGANTFNNLTVAARAASGVGSLILSANQTINGAFTVQSGATDPTRRLVISSNTIGTARTITSASNTIFGADFRDITAAGVASWSDSSRTNYWGDCKGNTGITFAAGRTVYWNLSGVQNWSSTGWAPGSGGTPAAGNFPLAQDTAAFTEAGSATTISTTSAYQIGSIDMSARTTGFTFNTNSNIGVYGNWTNNTTVNVSSGTSTITFLGRNTQLFTANGRSFGNSVVIDSPGGTVQLIGDLILSVNFGFLNLSSGTFDANDYNITALEFSSSNSNTRTLLMGSGLWTLAKGSFSPWDTSTTTNLTFNAGTSNILFSSTAGSNRTFAGGGLTFNKFTIGGVTGVGTVTITGANTFNELASVKTAALSIIFGANQTINTWSVTGSSGNVVTVSSNSAGTARTLTITNRTSGIDYLYVSDITAPLTPVTFFIGANSRLFGNTQGVAATTAPSNRFVYVLNTGTSWTVPANWESTNNEIHLFGAGGGGSGFFSGGAGNPGAGGAGGGGGGYTKITNLSLTPGGSVSYAIGAAGTAGGANSNGGNGGTTTFNSGAYSASGGGGATLVNTPPRQSFGGTGGTGSTYNGGDGGKGAEFATFTSQGAGAGGGGGAGGPLGDGADGGISAAGDTNNIAGGGGGGNGGGSNGGNASAAVGGTGGNNNAGVGGGAAATSGFNGGGSGGTVGLFGSRIPGSSGVDIVKAGLGGGGGAGGPSRDPNSTGPGGLYGGGGSGGGSTPLGVVNGGGPGAQGGIIIWYETPIPTTGNFFFLFN